MVVVLLLAPFALAASAPSTRNNDDSCDIGVYPAATLLLPYFEVETARHTADTLFTLTNVSRQPQIAHVTIWTDWALPVLSFNIFLTGYDTHSISLYDVVVNGTIAPGTPPGTSSTIKSGPLSSANNANPNLVLDDCGRLPGIISAPIRAAVQSALTRGIFSAFGLSACNAQLIGSPAAVHRTSTMAQGYVTIDVIARCSSNLPTDPNYFEREILFDNVLTGDVFALTEVLPGKIVTAASPLVHIRAIPEGGAAGAEAVATTLPYTFYGRYIQSQSPRIDRRQPLASTFAAHIAANAALSTSLKIWREGVAGAPACSTAVANATLPFQELVRFDEHENPSVIQPCRAFCPVPPQTSLPAASINNITRSLFPQQLSTTGDSGGWLYLNLDSGVSDQTINRQAHPDFSRRASQNWVTVSMFGFPSLATEFDAASLGNGCSPPVGTSVANKGDARIGPAGGVLVCPPGFFLILTSPCIPVYTGTNVNP